MLSVESMDQPDELPVVESLTMSPEKFGKPFPPHFKTSPLSSQVRAFDTSCVARPVASAR